MRHVDRLVIKELFGPWIFGVAIFSTLILAGSFLFELTRYIAQGANIMQVAQLAAMLTPGVVAKTFPMAVLLATLLAFGRLSGDSEIVALRAGGVSLPRIIAPVGVFGFLVSLLTVGFNELVVPAPPKMPNNSNPESRSFSVVAWTAKPAAPSLKTASFAASSMP